MSSGLGWIQRACLRVIAACEAAGEQATTAKIVIEVYQIKSDSRGHRNFNRAQLSATNRALGNLRKKGLITGEQHFEVLPDGSRFFQLARANNRAERCCIWSLS